MKKIILDKRTLRVLTPSEEALVAGGDNTDDDDDGDGDSGDIGIGNDDGDVTPPKGTFDSECRCPSDSQCAATQQVADPKCNVKGD